MKERSLILVKLPVRLPKLNSRCGRVIQTMRHDSLNHFIIVGEDGQNYLLEVNHIPNVTRFPEIWERYSNLVVG